MRVEEAIYLADLLKAFSAEELSPCLNVGSSTRAFREVIKPHISRDFIQPLERHGVRFIHADMKPGDGIDICGNLFDADIQKRLAELGVRSLLLNNVLEHVTDRESLARLCVSLVPVGSLLVVTVPYSYPYHADPIDTLYRPSPEQIAALFVGTELVSSGIVSAGSAREDLFPSGSSIAGKSLRHLARLLTPFYKPKAWLTHAHRLIWLFKPYRISIAILRRRC